MPTIFTRIIEGELPCYKVYEDDICFAFLDINPVTKWHTLIVPKQEYQRMTDTPDATVSHMFVVAKHLMQRMKEALWAHYVQVHVEWMDVPHFHIHLIPVHLWTKVVSFSHTSYQDGEQQELIEKLHLD